MTIIEELTSNESFELISREDEPENIKFLLSSLQFFAPVSKAATANAETQPTQQLSYNSCTNIFPLSQLATTVTLLEMIARTLASLLPSLFVHVWFRISRRRQF